MKHRILSATPLAALALLAACNTKPTAIVQGGPDDPDAAKVAAAKPIKLPPAMLASKSYRCKDNSLVYIDWFNDSMTANLHLKTKTADPINLSAPKAGDPYSGGGYTLTGTADAKSVNVKHGGSGQDCDA